jgi:integrase/recombinase XerC
MKKKKPHPTKGKKLPRDLLDDRELKALAAACGDGDAADRNRAFIAVLTGTGIRVSEALNLMPADINLRTRRIIVRGSTNGEARTVWLHPDAVPPLRTWHKVRVDLGLADCPLFCSLEGARINSSYIRGMLPNVAKDAGIKKRVYTDGLRHVFARKAYEAKATRRSIQIQFGHANITTTVALLERLGLHDGFAEFEASFER